MTFLLKLLTTIIACMVFYGKVGVPAAILLFGDSFFLVFSVSLFSGFAGNVLFTNLSDALIKAIHRYRLRRHKIHSRRIFKASTRRLIRVKNRFGLAGIAFISPMFLSIPLGTFLADKFFRDKRRIIIYFTISEAFWTVVLYLILVQFHGSFRSWLNEG
jgi:hypothetical protein